MCHVVMQEQFFRQWQRDPQSPANNVGFNAVITGNLDLAALQKAAVMVFERQQVSPACQAPATAVTVTRRGLGMVSMWEDDHCVDAQVLRTCVVATEDDPNSAAAQRILPMQDAALSFVCTTLAAAWRDCITLQQDGSCSMVAGIVASGCRSVHGKSWSQWASWPRHVCSMLQDMHRGGRHILLCRVRAGGRAASGSFRPL